MNETQKPMITTIIPTYRRPQQLKQAIGSVLQQTYPHFQVCVYDNASGDDTALVVAEMAKTDPRVKYYCHPENIGAYNNFQYGLQHVETPFFSFLSDDDLILPEFYETALAGFESHPDAMFSATDVFRVGMQSRLLGMSLETWTSGVYHPPEGLMAALEHGCSLWTGFLFRRTVTEVVGLLDRETGTFGDTDFTLRAVARCPFVVSKRPCAVVDISWERASIPVDEIWRGLLKMTRNLTEDKGIPIDVRDHAERVLLGGFENGLFRLGISYLFRGCADDARKVAVLLRDQFGGRARYIALSAMINTQQYVPFTRLAFSSLLAFRRHLNAKRIKNNPVLPVSVWWRV